MQPAVVFHSGASILLAAVVLRKSFPIVCSRKSITVCAARFFSIDLDAVNALEM